MTIRAVCIALMGIGLNAYAEVARVCVTDSAWSHSDASSAGIQAANTSQWRVRLSSWAPLEFQQGSGGNAGTVAFGPSSVPDVGIAYVRPVKSDSAWDIFGEVQWRLMEHVSATSGSQWLSIVRAEIGPQYRMPGLLFSWIAPSFAVSVGPAMSWSQTTQIGWVARGEFSFRVPRWRGQPQLGMQITTGSLGASRLDGLGMHVGISL